MQGGGASCEGRGEGREDKWDIPLIDRKRSGKISRHGGKKGKGERKRVLHEKGLKGGHQIGFWERDAM